MPLALPESRIEIPWGPASITAWRREHLESFRTRSQLGSRPRTTRVPCSSTSCWVPFGYWTSNFTALLAPQATSAVPGCCIVSARAGKTVASSIVVLVLFAAVELRGERIGHLPPGGVSSERRPGGTDADATSRGLGRFLWGFGPRDGDRGWRRRPTQGRHLPR